MTVSVGVKEKWKRQVEYCEKIQKDWGSHKWEGESSFEIRVENT